MLNPRLVEELNDYPFARLNSLIKDVAPPPGRQFVMSVGEPQGSPPDFVRDIVGRDLAIWGKYPPNQGTPELVAAAANWLTRRYALPKGLIDPAKHVLPFCGSKEGVYAIGTVAVPQTKNGGKPAVLLPNPFYQAYLGSAVLSGGEPVFLNTHKDNGFLPDYDAVPEETWRRAALVYLCSPGNPQGAVASLDFMKKLIAKCRKYGAILVIDECYAEIYSADPPPGGLQAALELDGKDAAHPFRNVVVFHSLSKRSSAAGLRSGFGCGDADVMAMLLRWKTYGGAQLPMPIQAASAALWDEDGHAVATRDMYRARFDIAEKILHNRFGFFKPAGGFFLWLDVGDGEAAALKLWKEGGIKVLPGKYLTRDDPDGSNPSSRYIRVALVHDLETVRAGLSRLAEIL